MNKLRFFSGVLLILSLSVFGCSKSQPAGSEGGKYVDGKKHGPWVHKNQSGGVKSKGSYKKGLKDGLWTFYYKDQTEHTEYKSGKKHGKHKKIYVKTEKTAIRGEYIDDVKHGEWVTFGIDGKEMSRGNYDHGNKHGPWKQIVSTDKVTEGEYVQGKKNGEWVEWHLGNKNAGSYTHGVKDGHWVTYTADGKKVMEGGYNKNRRTGEWERWYPDGAQLASVTFNQLGQQDGTATLYHPNGQKKSESVYKNGELEGKTKNWDEEGNEIKERKKRVDFTDLLNQARANGDL